MHFLFFIVNIFLLCLICEYSNSQENDGFVSLDYFHFSGIKDERKGWFKRGGAAEIENHEKFLRIFFEDNPSRVNYLKAMRVGKVKNAIQLRFLIDIGINFPEPEGMFTFPSHLSGETYWDRVRSSIGILSTEDNEWKRFFIFRVYRSGGNLYGLVEYFNENYEEIHMLDDEILLVNSYNPSRVIEIVVEFDNFEGNNILNIFAESEKRYSLSNFQFGAKNLEHVNFGIVHLSNQYIAAPSGYIDLHECEILLKKVEEIFVSTDGDDDLNDGKSRDNPFKTVTKALPYLTPGTNVIFSQGIYRGESLSGFSNGNHDSPIVFRKENENSKVVLSGSFNSGSFTKTKIPPNEKEVYYLDLSSISGVIQDTPRFVVQLSDDFDVVGRFNVSQMPSFRAPKKGREFDPYFYWFKADGGSYRPGLKPDWKNQVQESQRSLDYLTYENFFWPNIVESYSFCDSQIDLVGATIVINDGNSGHYTYTRKIIEHDFNNCRVRVDNVCYFNDISRPALGAAAEFILSNKLQFLTQENEVYFDNSTKRLYVFAPSTVDWNLIEIQTEKNQILFNLQGISNIIIDGITIMNYDFVFYEKSGYGEGYIFTQNITVKNCQITHCNYVVQIQRGLLFNSSLRNYRFENNEFSYIDSQVFNVMMAFDDDTFDSHNSVGISEFHIIGNRMYHIAFNSDSDNRNGNIIWDPDHFYVVSNIFERIAHNGIVFVRSHRKSQYVGKTNDPDIVTCCNLVFNNTFQSCCNGNCDCGGLKIYGTTNGDEGVFDRFLVMNNVALNTFGVCFPSYIQGKWYAENNGSVVLDGPNRLSGLGGWGLYLDRGAGVTWYRNLAINSGLSGMHFYTAWELGVNVIMNNVFVGGKFGAHLSARTFDFSDFSRTDVKNNVFFNNYRYGLKIDGQAGSNGFPAPEKDRIYVDHNLYFDVGKVTTTPDSWNHQKGLICVYFSDGNECFVENVTNLSFEKYPNFDGWELNGLGELDPEFKMSQSLLNKLTDPNIVEITRDEALEFWKTTQPLIDGGTEDLPEELKYLLDYFGICDLKSGKYFDVGSRENNYGVGYCGDNDVDNTAVVLGVVLSLLFVFLCFLLLLVCVIVILAFWFCKKKKEGDGSTFKDSDSSSDNEKEMDNV